MAYDLTVSQRPEPIHVGTEVRPQRSVFFGCQVVDNLVPGLDKDESMTCSLGPIG